MMRLVNGIIVALSLVFVPHVLAAGDADAGQAKTAVCAACHAADGNSTAPLYPKLAGLGENYLLKQMQDIKSGERPVLEMTGMLNNLSEQDLADIAAYYNGKQRQVAGAREVKLELGEKIYRGGNIDTGVPACTGCHSPSGNGNAPAGYPAIGGQYADYITKQLRAFRTAAHDADDSSGRANDGDTAVMRGVAARLTDQEIEGLANFISGLH